MTKRPHGSAPLRLLRDSDTRELSPPATLSVVAEAGPLDLDGLYRRHASYVAAVAVRLLGRDEEVDDVVQDVFLEAVRGIASVRDPNAVKGWLARIAVRTCVRRLQKRKLFRALQLQLESQDYEQLAGPRATPEQRVLIAKVYRLLDRLPARTRVIWILRHVLDESLQTMVELTACSQSTVQRKLREAEHLLEQELRDE
jgi:RNA polymerase sigma-70 factor (ECF subfamily)